MEEVRNVEAVIKTKQTAMEDKSKGFTTVGIKRAPNLVDLLQDDEDLIESCRNVNIPIIKVPASESSIHSYQLTTTSMVLRRRRIEGVIKGEKKEDK